jgi:hypothetical protein
VQNKHIRKGRKKSQNNLDKLIRFYNRIYMYDRDLALNVESVSSRDPNPFWDQRKTKFPTECYNIDGIVTNDIKKL